MFPLLRPFELLHKYQLPYFTLLEASDSETIGSSLIYGIELRRFKDQASLGISSIYLEGLSNKLHRYTSLGVLYLLHEASHLLCGPSTLKNEDAMQPLQWRLVQELDEPWREAALQGYCHLYVPAWMQTPSVFLHHDLWYSWEKEATEKGYLNSQGEILLQGPHRDWSIHDYERTDRRQRRR